MTIFKRLNVTTFLLHFSFVFLSSALHAEENKFFNYLTRTPSSRMVGYTPAELDPRNPNNNVTLKSSSLRADLAALRPAFDGLILYGYNEACTPRIVAIAKQLDYRAVVLAIWQPKSMAEVDGVAQLALQHQEDLAIAVLIGNEGIIFGRYEFEDLQIAESRLRKLIGTKIPYSTSEPLVGYQSEKLLKFGDFLAPNIHPVFDLPDAKAPQAVQWVKSEARNLRDAALKPVIVKETGFPHAGKPIYTQQTQKNFWQEYTADGLLERKGENWVSFAVGFEALDLPWKSEASGLEIEKSWGLLSNDRKPYPAFEIWKSIKTQ